MALVEMVMPKMGESVMEGTIISWLKNVGDTIEQDESVLEVATDKVDTEVPALQGGILKEILAKEGEVVQVGKAIAIIETATEEKQSIPEESSPAAEVKAEKSARSQQPESTTSKQEHISVSRKSLDASRFYSPLVLSIAKEENISTSELNSINGSGKDQRVTKNDILEYVKSRGSKQEISSSKPAKSLNGNIEIIEMDRMRKMIADRMVESKRISPHVTSFVEADVTTIVQWRSKWKNQIMERESLALTYTPIFIEAVIKALKDFPMVNISVEGDKILVKRDINIGVAVALPNNNLIVPVIKNADRLNIIGLTKAVNDLAKRARANKLTADDLSGGTYTISNVGSFGNVMGTPIIVQPQAAILALGAVQKIPAVIETPQGDTLGIRQMMFLSHSYDHRVIDGALGGMFVRKVADYLEEFDINRKPF
jgi:2-oxoglutarate dehydrogenase E2 component (dihydrolipoamide succinyltransferase)